MGVTLHYCGQLRESALLPDLIAEVQDICQSMEWPCKSIDLLMDDGIDPAVIRFLAGEEASGVHLQGLSFQPHPESESVVLTFTPAGHLVAPFSVIAGDAYPELDDIYWTHCKTQFAGPDVHMAVCHLLDYLSQRYLKNFDVLDESQYWSTRDKDQLYRLFQRTQKAIDSFADALENLDMPDVTDTEELVQRLEEIFRRLLKKRP